MCESSGTTVFLRGVSSQLHDVKVRWHCLLNCDLTLECCHSLYFRTRKGDALLTCVVVSLSRIRLFVLVVGLVVQQPTKASSHAQALFPTTFIDCCSSWTDDLIRTCCCTRYVLLLHFRLRHVRMFATWNSCLSTVFSSGSLREHDVSLRCCGEMFLIDFAGYR